MPTAANNGLLRKMEYFAQKNATDDRNRAPLSTDSPKNSSAQADIRTPATLFEILASLTIAAGAVWIVSRRAFWDFHSYDDEGYMLTSLIEFVRRGGLYTSTFSQYGPFFFFAQQMLHSVLHLPLTEDGARALTLLEWLLAGGLFSAFVYRTTRQLLLCSVAFLSALMMMQTLVWEPGHPQELIVTLIAISLFASTFIGERFSVWASAVLGACGALLPLTKINVGLFFLEAVVLSLVFTMAAGRLRRNLLIICSVGALAIPATLMRAYLQSWALPLCLLATVCTALVLLAGWRVKAKTQPRRNAELVGLVSGFVLCAVVVLGASLKSGVSAAVLFKGIILEPLHHPHVFFIPLPFPAHHLALAGIPLAIGVGWLLAVRHIRGAILRCLPFVEISAGLIGLVVAPAHAYVSAFVLPPLLPLALFVPGTSGRKGLFWRSFLVTILAFEFLQVYPVAGSQLRIAFAPIAAWACVLIYDGFADAPFAERVLNWFRITPLRLVAGLAAAILVLSLPEAGFHLHAPGPPLPFPGASRIHVDPKEARTYTQLVRAIRENCDSLWSMPGMFSLNLWSGVPTPDGYNMTGWMESFPLSMQQAVLDDLLKSSRPCIVENTELLRWWMPMGDAALARSPIARYVQRQTYQVFAVADYSLRVPDPH